MEFEILDWLLEKKKTIEVNGFGRLYFAFGSTLLTVTLIKGFWTDLVNGAWLWKIFIGLCMVIWTVWYVSAMRLLFGKDEPKIIISPYIPETVDSKETEFWGDTKNTSAKLFEK